MFPLEWTLEQITHHAFREILTNQKIIIKLQEKTMSALDDTKAALSAVNDKVTKLSTDVDAFIKANSGGATDVDLAGLTASLGALGSAVDAIDAVVNPPAPAAPTV